MSREFEGGWSDLVDANGWTYRIVAVERLFSMMHLERLVLSDNDIHVIVADGQISSGNLQLVPSDQEGNNLDNIIKGVETVLCNIFIFLLYGLLLV